MSTNSFSLCNTTYEVTENLHSSRLISQNTKHKDFQLTSNWMSKKSKNPIMPRLFTFISQHLPFMLLLSK